MNEPRRRFIVALAQIDPTVGDVDGNAALIAEWIARARDAGADLVVLPELCLPGYPAEDLYLKRHFAEANAAALERLAAEAPRDHRAGRLRRARPAGRGRARRRPRRAPGPQLARGARATARCEAVYRKNRLPNYGVFDEVRYFEPGERAADDRGRGVTRRADDLRGRLGARAAGVARGRGGRRADRQPLGLALPPRQGREREGMFAERARALRRPDRLLQPGRRPGRARLRRPQLRRRRRGRAGRPGAAVRGGAAGLRARRRRPGRLERAARRPRRGLRGAGPRPARLRRARTASSRVVRRALGRHRLGPGRADRRRRARRRAASPAWSCRPPTPAMRPRPTRGRSPPTSAPS